MTPCVAALIRLPCAPCGPWQKPPPGPRGRPKKAKSSDNNEDEAEDEAEGAAPIEFAPLPKHVSGVANEAMRAFLARGVAAPPAPIADINRDDMATFQEMVGEASPEPLGA